ncbi:MAG: ROK family transcriptional regulator [Spirochaeta sp.]|nr:ROK family transcriptional regulator [Spirochaeta sp.]
MATAGKRNRMMNRSRILRVIWHHPGTSRVDIAGALGLDKSTVSSIVTDLIESEIVFEVAQGDASPQGGRRPVRLQLNARYGFVLGVELQPGFFRAALTDLTGAVIRTWSAERPRENASFEEYVLVLLQELLGEIGEYRDRLVGIGCAMGGLVNSIRNVIYRSIPMRIETEYDFQRRIAEEIGIPVVAENDANACAWGELTAHRGKTVHDFLYVLVQIRGSTAGKHLYGGIGVGLGVAINGTLYPGSRFTAGEFRSAFWDGEGIGQFTLTEDEAAAVGTDPAIRERLFRELAKNIALIINVLNLDHLFIGGDILTYRDKITPIIREELLHNWPYSTGVECEICYSSYGEVAVAAGAAGMMLDRLFSDQIFPLGDIRNRHERTRVLAQLNQHGFNMEPSGGS